MASWPDAAALHVQAARVDMEQEFLNVGLDIIGLGVFNYDFASITTQSPVIKVHLALHAHSPLPQRSAYAQTAGWTAPELTCAQGHWLQAVYGVLKEAEHRSTFYIPYWKLPLASTLVPRQRRFREDIGVINACLDDLIAQAKRTRNADDAEALQARDYAKVLLA